MLSFPTAPVSHRFSLTFLSKLFLLLLQKTLAKRDKGYEKMWRPWCQNPRQLVGAEELVFGEEGACRGLLRGGVNLCQGC